MKPVREKAALAALMRASKAGLITVEAAAPVLRLSPAATSARMARLIKAGWAQRVRRGMYLLLPVEAEPGLPVTAEDPWILARELFSPCYIGGWSAAEYWGFTEQIFRSTLVVTSAAIRQTSATHLSHDFRLYIVTKKKLSAGVSPVWRGTQRVATSNPERTLVDGFNAPRLAGGIRHLTQWMAAYAESEKYNATSLATIAKTCASGAAWKRLGFLAERIWPAERTLVEEAGQYVSAGYARLDPTVRAPGRFDTRWKLWINVDLEASKVLRPTP